MPSLLHNLALGARLAFQAFKAPVAFGAHALVENASGHVLLVRHTYMPGWFLPGGGVNRGEPAQDAVIRELKEEVNLQRYARCELFGLYTRPHFWTTNVIALYRVRGAEIAFAPNSEIREAIFVSSDAPPDGTGVGALRRLAELRGDAPHTPFW